MAAAVDAVVGDQAFVAAGDMRGQQRKTQVPASSLSILEVFRHPPSRCARMAEDPLGG